MHTCPLFSGPVAHIGGPILPPGCPTVLIGGQPAARVGDMATCAGGPDVIAIGATSTLIGGQPAARMTDQTVHGGMIVIGYPTVLIGRLMFVRIVIIQGTFWDSPAGRANIAQQIAQAEAILGITIVTGPFDVINNPGMQSFPSGPWNGTNNYSPQEVGAINSLSTANRPAVIFTQSMTGTTAAGITVSQAWAGTNDGLTQDGIIAQQPFQNNNRDLAHEFGHLLSRQTGNNTHSTTPGDLMDTTASGANWNDPWRSAAATSPYLH
jgi:uncharacterized Zn-binding protein involved in type VI secretion